MSEVVENVIKVGVVDDHPFVHKGLGAVIGIDPELELSWTSGSAEEAIVCLADEPVDVVIVDIKLGSSSGGIQVLEQLNRMRPAPKALVLSAFVSRRIVSETARLGACGYFVKTQGVEEVLEAAKRVAISDEWGFLGPFSTWARPNPFMELSRRELDVLMAIAKGHSNPKVAELLGLKVGTVKTHLESIYRKLGARSRTDALRAALGEGYFHIDEIS